MGASTRPKATTTGVALVSNARSWLIRGGLVALLVGSFFFVRSMQGFTPPETELGERTDGSFFTMLTEEGDVVARTAVIVDVGDQYIDEANRLFEVTAIRGDEVLVKALGAASMPDVSDVLRAFEEGGAAQVGGANRNDSRVEVGIYHTHNAESYEPTSGTAFKDEGDIYQVGRALADALKSRGHTVTWNSASHLPHDGQAYLRSRRTAIRISRERPVTILDIHRDAVPDPDEYLATVNGEQMSRVRLVVGRQNQNREANLEYAKRIKAIADERYPGLILGIFNARGNYNQDLGPRMMLLEFGTHVTSLEQALRSVEPMAEVIAAAAGIMPGTGSKEVGSAGARTALWIVVLTILGGAAWAMINKEGWQRFKDAIGRVLPTGGPKDGSDQQ